MKTVVLGIGNILLRDEGVGVRVVERLAAQQPASTNSDRDEIDYLDGGTLSFTLAAPIGEADRMIVIDASNLDAPPGTVTSFHDDAMDAFLGSRKRSVHEIGLLDLIDMARMSRDLPARRSLVAIQPGIVDWGDQLSTEVEDAADTACEIVRSLIDEWNRQHDGSNPEL